MTANPTFPSHWKIGNIRRFAQMKSGHTPNRSVPDYWVSADIPWFTLADVWQLRDDKQIYLGDTANKINELGLANSAAELLPAGTVVLSRTASVGFSGIMPKPMATSQDFWNWVCGRELLPEYLNYQFKSMRTEFKSLNMGSTHQTIYQKDAAGLQISVPPLEEQRAIAVYLDRETSRIDTLIEEQQLLSELLRERRRALRVHVTLHGSTPTEEVESSLPWANQLPENWAVVPLTSVAQLESGHTPSRSREDWWTDCYIPWVSLHDVGTMRETKYLQDTAQRISDAGIVNSSARLLPAHTVVLSRDATVGRTAIIGVPMATSQHFAAWICGPLLDPEYLWALFADAMQPLFDSFRNGSTIRTIGMGDLKSFRIPLPPLDEQRRIVEYLDEETPKIDTLIAETEKFIALARERRSALITAAVTGQIDVRETA